MYVILCAQKGERIEGNDELVTCMTNDEQFVALYYIHSVDRIIINSNTFSVLFLQYFQENTDSS